MIASLAASLGGVEDTERSPEAVKAALECSSAALMLPVTHLKELAMALAKLEQAGAQHKEAAGAGVASQELRVAATAAQFTKPEILSVEELRCAACVDNSKGSLPC